MLPQGDYKDLSRNLLKYSTPEPLVQLKFNFGSQIYQFV
jgi:hypothetical protein